MSTKTKNSTLTVIKIFILFGYIFCDTVYLLIIIFWLQKKRKVADRDDIACTSDSVQETKEESAPVGKKAKSEPKVNGTMKPTKTSTVSDPTSSSKIRQTGLRTTATGVAKAASNHDEFNNPTCRDAFKSLFTSSQPDQAKDKTSNWITCNSYK